MRAWWCAVALVCVARAAGCAPGCACGAEHVWCSGPLYRAPAPAPAARHVALWAARLGALPDAALSAPLLTLVLPACHLHALEPQALQSMTATLASLDLSYNEFTEIPFEALRKLRVLNWLNLQNNMVSEVPAQAQWGGLEESLDTLSLSNNRLVWVHGAALAALRRLRTLELDGNRLLALDGGALPAALHALRLGDNLLAAPPCPLPPHLRLLQLRHNQLRALGNASCATPRRLHTLDLSHNELTDGFSAPPAAPRRLLLDLNHLTQLPPAALSARLHHLSLAHNRVRRLAPTALLALPELRRLDLDHNLLTTLPAEIALLLQLRHLSLAYNQLHEVPALPPRLLSLSLAGNFLEIFPKALQRLEARSLQVLDMGYNRLAVLPGAWGTWAAALRTLHLRGNRLAHVAVLPALPTLRELALSFSDVRRVELRALPTLRVLEMSSARLVGGFPLRAPAPALTWLALDNNDIHHVSAAELSLCPALEYLNLDFNKITELPSGGSFSTNFTFKFREVRLAYNYVHSLSRHFLSALVELQTLDLSNNYLENVNENDFSGMPSLSYLTLAENHISLLSASAFHDLPRLESLDVHGNQLGELSTRSFSRVGTEVGFSLNASHNHIATLAGGGAAHVLTLDLAHNWLTALSAEFFAALAPLLRRVELAHNWLAVLDALPALPRLQTLVARHNNVSELSRRALLALPALHVLDLSHNHLVRLAPEQFSGARQLRVLRLDNNELRALPRDAFRDTALEYVDLSDNQLGVFPGGALAGAGGSLRRLELAGNRLEHLDAAMFRGAGALRELGLARNALTMLPDNALAGLPRLQRLDLAHNAVKSNFKELFHHALRLRTLSLAGCGLRAAPALPLPNLTELDLSGNRLAALSAGDVRQLRALRSLNVSHNAFAALAPGTWGALARLEALDVSHNPLTRLPRGALVGLSRLLQLRMLGLPLVEADARALAPLVALRSLALSSPAGGATVAAWLRAAPHVEALTLEVREAVLDVQLAGVRAPRLRVVELCGARLRHVAPGALDALGGQRALALRLRGSRVSALPAGLAAALHAVPLLSLQLRDNRLAALPPAVLYPNHTNWDRFATKVLMGGLEVSEAGMQCACAGWLGAWLRRWTAEVGGGGGAAREAAARSTCAGAGGPGRLLRAAGHCAPARAARGGGRAAPLLGLAAVLAAALR